MAVAVAVPLQRAERADDRSLRDAGVGSGGTAVHDTRCRSAFCRCPAVVGGDVQGACMAIHSVPHEIMPHTDIECVRTPAGVPLVSRASLSLATELIPGVLCACVRCVRRVLCAC